MRAAAYVFGNAEVAWPNAVAAAAIDALAASEKLLADESREAAVERARQEALDALALAKSQGTHVLISWS